MDFYRSKCTASARDQQPLSVNERIRDFSPGAVIDGGDRGSGDVHSGGAGFLGEAFIVQEPQSFKLVHRHPDAFFRRHVIRRKTAVNREPLDPAASDRPWHKHLLSGLSWMILPEFLPYVNNCDQRIRAAAQAARSVLKKVSKKSFEKNCRCAAISSGAPYQLV
jgi:hypothetical protein